MKQLERDSVGRARDDTIITAYVTEVQFFAPDQLGLLALFNGRVKEAAENVLAISGSDAAQARMIGQRFVEVIPHIPAHAEPISCLTHELPFQADTLEKHDQLQFEKSACSRHFLDDSSSK